MRTWIERGFLAFSVGCNSFLLWAFLNVQRGQLQFRHGSVIFKVLTWGH